jgi:hypothetical protein
MRGGSKEHEESPYMNTVPLTPFRKSDTIGRAAPSYTLVCGVLWANARSHTYSRTPRRTLHIRIDVGVTVSTPAVSPGSPASPSPSASPSAVFSPALTTSVAPVSFSLSSPVCGSGASLSGETKTNSARFQGSLSSAPPSSLAVAPPKTSRSASELLHCLAFLTICSRWWSGTCGRVAKTRRTQRE